MIKLEHVDKYFGDLHVLKDVNLEVAEGEKLVIIGPSGSGKSTTVRCMNFLEEPTSGHVYINGEELTNKNKTRVVRENISMVFQQFNLYPHMTVLKNLTLAPMKLHHKTKAEAEELAYHYLEVVGLRDKADVYPPQLSGGQQQRIAIARALCAQTKIILFDEPTSALDPETIQEVLDGANFDADTFNADTWKEGISFRQYDDYPAISTALSANEIQGFCVDKSILAIYKTDGRSYVDAEFSPQEYGIATKKGSDFSTLCDELVQGWLADGTVESLIKENGLS